MKTIIQNGIFELRDMFALGEIKDLRLPKELELDKRLVILEEYNRDYYYLYSRKRC